MSLTITQHDDKWRIAIDETWQFEDIDQFNTCLKSLVHKKELFGQLQKSKDKDRFNTQLKKGGVF